MKKIRVAGWMTGMGAAAAVLALSAQTAWAGSWIEEPMGWFYEKGMTGRRYEAGTRLTAFGIIWTRKPACGKKSLPSTGQTPRISWKI